MWHAICSLQGCSGYSDTFREGRIMVTTKNPVTPAKVTKNLPPKKPVNGGIIIANSPTPKSIIDDGDCPILYTTR